MNFKPMIDFMDRLTEWRIPGNSISIYIDNKEVFNYSSGYADIENKIPMTADKLINIYSCSKPATVIGALQLYEKGFFLLDDPVYDFIPEFKDMYINTENGLKKAENSITMRHLFTMTSGITYNTNSNAFKKAAELTDGKMNTVTLAKCIASDPLDFEPGKQWKYGLNHDILGAVVEIISGKKFRDYMHENVFEPLGIKNTLYHNDDVQNQMAQQYSFKDQSESNIVNLQASGDSRKGGELINVGKARNGQASEFDSGGSGVVTSVNEYSKFVSALANGGIGPNGERIIAESTIRLMRQNQLSEVQRQTMVWPQLKGYGYGLGVRTLIDKAASGSTGPLGEFGWGGAAGATVLADLDNRISMFYAHHMLNPQETYYQPRLRNVLYTCITG